MDGIFETFRRLGPVKLTLLGGVAIGLIVFFTFFASKLSAPPMALLYGDVAAQDAGPIVSRLEAQGVPYELRAGGTQIWAPSDRVLRLRMSFAEQGLPRGGSVGYEIFDKGESLGTTSFTQNLNHLRALEGELARTIASLSPVMAARVHLVIPRREIFTRERQEPTASVVLRMREAGRLGKPQVQAIQHLVAAGVQGLKPGRVSVIDDRGNLLARGNGDADEAQSTATNAEEMRRAYEQRLTRTIEELLERSIGAGKVRAEVSADMDFDRIVTNSESFDPDGQVVRSTQTVSESGSSTDGAGNQPVSVGANIPGADPGAGGGARSGSQNARSEETINYEISRTTKSHVREAGIVRRLSVAVVVDGSYAAGADGQRSYTPRKPEELQQITALVRSAIGFNEKRGDTIEVANLPFVQIDDMAPPEPPGMFDLSKQDYFRIAELAALAVTGILVVLLVARPLVTNLVKATPVAAAAGAPGTAMLPDHSGGAAPALAAPEGMAPQTLNMAANIEQMIDLNQVEGRVRASSIKKIGEIVEKHPEEAVSIVRTWMYQER